MKNIHCDDNTQNTYFWQGNPTSLCMRKVCMTESLQAICLFGTTFRFTYCPTFFCSFGFVQLFKNLLYFYTVSILNKINPTLSFNIINPVLNVHKIKLILKNRWVRSMLVFPK